MKVYVENGDIPKRCIECRFCYYSEDEYHHCCRINGIDIENKKCWRETHPDCPLLSISDYTKQVRKEVLGELMNMLGDRAELIDCGGVAEFMFTTYDLTMCVKEILGEEKGEPECQK